LAICNNLIFNSLSHSFPKLTNVEPSKRNSPHTHVSFYILKAKPWHWKRWFIIRFDLKGYSRHLSKSNYIITQVILAFWLVLAYDLLEDRRIDDDSAWFNFFEIFWILNLNQSQFFAKHSNQSVRFILYRHRITSVLF